MKTRVVAVLIAFLMLLSVAACATTSVILTGTAPFYNASPGSCAASVDTLRDLKEIVIETRPTGTTTWSIVKRGPAVRGAPFTFFIPSISEALWDFAATAFDSTGNGACRDTVIGYSTVRAPGKASGLQVTAP